MTEYNLESGRPPADIAVSRLASITAREKAGGKKAFKIIHGYGSSGVGGRIRTEVRRWLTGEKARKKIKTFIPGEDFTIFNTDTLALFSVFPEARRDKDLERGNMGVTIIVL